MPSNHQLARDFLAALAAGQIPDELVTEDLGAWTLTSGDMEGAKFRGAAGLLAGVFQGSLRYDIDALTAEDDRVVAEARSSGTLPDGAAFANHHVFTFRVRDGRVAWVGEYMNPIIVQEQLLPHLQAAMQSRG